MKRRQSICYVLLGRQRQRGDTIIEVLIAATVISAVIMGAYLLTQRSTSTVLYAQEHAEMVQVLQGQVEQVRALALAQKTPTGGIYSPGEFCVDASDPTDIKPVYKSDGENLSGEYANKCTNINDRYTVAVSYDSGTRVFNFKGNWDGLSGGVNNASLVYRIYSGP